MGREESERGNFLLSVSHLKTGNGASVLTGRKDEEKKTIGNLFEAA